MRLLNVGGGSKDQPIPEIYKDYEHVLLDIAAGPDVDLCMDARDLVLFAEKRPAGYDAVYCSHNLEHYFAHDVPKVLAGMRQVLKPGGQVHIVVPNIGQLICDMLAMRIDLEDVLFQAEAGPITCLDVIWGYGPEIEESGQDFYAHKTGFTAKRLHRVLMSAGFTDIKVYTNPPSLELIAFGKAPALKGIDDALQERETASVSARQTSEDRQEVG